MNSFNCYYTFFYAELILTFRAAFSITLTQIPYTQQNTFRSLPIETYKAFPNKASKYCRHIRKLQKWDFYFLDKEVSRRGQYNGKSENNQPMEETTKKQIIFCANHPKEIELWHKLESCLQNLIKDKKRYYTSL